MFRSFLGLVFVSKFESYTLLGQDEGAVARGRKNVARVFDAEFRQLSAFALEENSSTLSRLVVPDFNLRGKLGASSGSPLTGMGNCGNGAHGS